MPAHPHSPEFADHARRFSDKVRRRCGELGMSQRDLVSSTGLSPGYIKLLMNNRGSHADPVTGERKPPNPTLEVIWKLADALRIDAAYLMDRQRDVEDMPIEKIS